MSEEKIIARIKKMLVLANDLAASEGERDNALRMAFATMAKYNIDMSKVDAATLEQAEPRIDFDNVGWSWLWAKQVRMIVADLFFCKYYVGLRWNGTQCKHHFVGREGNAMTAAVMSDYVVDSILREGRKLYKQNTAPGTRAFAIGAMHRLHERVNEIKKTQTAASDAESKGTALVLASLYVTEQKANEEWLEARVELKTSKARSHAIADGNAYQAGREFGANINLSAQMTEESRKLT